MSYSSDIAGPGFFIKPRYRHEVLINNWYEDRALHDPTFLPMSASKPKSSELQDNKDATADSVNKDLQNNASGENSATDRNCDCNKLANNRDKNQQLAGPVSLSDPLRGYYATTYKRAYGPRHGYMFFDSTANNAGDSRRYATTLSNSNQNFAQQSDTAGCPRCKQLENPPMESSSCPRCLQLAGL